RETTEAVREAFLADGVGRANAYLDRQKIRQEIVSTTGASRAAWKLDILAATGPGRAIVGRTAELRTAVSDPVSGLPATNTAVNLLASRVNTIDGQLVAQNDAILQLDSSLGALDSDVDLISAAGLFRASTAAAPSGATARIALSVAASAGGS